MDEQSTGGARPVPGPVEREVLTGPVVPPASRRTASTVAGDLAGAAAERARQVSELLSGTARLLAGVLGASAVAGAVAAVVITGLLAAAFDWSTVATVVVLVVLALPAVEVAVHRQLLLRSYGNADGLRRRFTDLPDATVGRVQDFTAKVGALRAGPGRRSGRMFGAARSAGSLRGIASAVPELTGVLLLPLTKSLLILTAACAALCWVLLVATPLVAVVALVGALTR